MAAIKELRRSREGGKEKGNSAGWKMSRTSAKHWLERGRKRIMASEGEGLLCFLQSCLSMLPGEHFPIYQCVRCGIQMTVCMYSEQPRDLEGHCLMSSL